jgi:glucosamine--fructose-6-phosphate aminotransferase (isomerizing)
MHDVSFSLAIAADSLLDERARRLVRDLHERERQASVALPTDEPLDAGRRRRVVRTRPEIFGQPEAIRATLKEERQAIREVAGAFAVAPPARIYLVGCGDSLTVMIGAQMALEELLHVPCEPVQALDFAYYRQVVLGRDALVIALSSSGATPRTVEALLAAKARGAHTLALSNTPTSALMAESEWGLRIHAERHGWPTQASTAALALLVQFGLDLALAQGGETPAARRLQAGLDAVPGQIEATLRRWEEAIAAIAEREAEAHIFLYTGGGPAYAAALFGAAKVKECTPDHGIAIPLEEFHHYNSQKRGDPLFLIAPRGPSLPRARDTATDGRRWGGRVYSIATEGGGELDECSDAVLALPEVPEELVALLYTVPLQLFAYHVAMAKFRRAAERTQA